MADGRIIKVRSVAGIKRDGTRLDGDNYVDGQWCRFQRGLPRKIGGYQSVVQDLPELVYGLSSFNSDGSAYVHLGSESQMQQRVLNGMGALTGSNDRTPAGLVADPANVWSTDFIFDVNEQDTVLVAHAAPNMDISSTQDADIFYGVVTDAGVLVTSGQDPVSGGVLVVGNYLVGYGSGGYVQWSEANDMAAVTMDATNVTQQKIVAARRVRGGGVPAALLWSLDSMLLMTYSPDPADPTQFWDFDTITDEASILSSRSVIEYDGIFYWLGVDRMMSYNGVTREVPNEMNFNHFFDNLNFQQRQKVFAYKVPRFGEIWWCYPAGGSEECDRAIILNVRENSWYDTALPDEGRTDGLYPKVYFKPFMTGVTHGVDGIDLWQHETGVNRVRLASVEPIPSHFETNEISMVAAEQSANKSLGVGIVEPDFVQSGDMTLTVRGRQNARSAERATDPAVITETAADADEQVVRFKAQRRLLSFRFDTNTVDGDYQAGETLAHLHEGDERVTE